MHVEQAECGSCSSSWLNAADAQQLNVTADVQIPEAERESYSKGQHLRGADAKNADRVRAEIVRTSEHLRLHTVNAVKAWVCEAKEPKVLNLGFGGCTLLHGLCWGNICNSDIEVSRISLD